MDKLFWVVPGELAGRAGPDREPWDLACLRQGGIGAVLSVNDGALCHPQDFESHGIRYRCIPLSDNAPPLPGDDATCRLALPRAYAFATAEIERGIAVLVHCSSGKDRTGLFLCYFLMRRWGMSVRKAIAVVRQVRPIALSAWGWEAFAERLLPQCT
ncbi:MAG: dual specificity protein phosphatase family protein [Acidiferrobacterales bacterium]